jgi:hypothetical protein
MAVLREYSTGLGGEGKNRVTYINPYEKSRFNARTHM